MRKFRKIAVAATGILTSLYWSAAIAFATEGPVTLCPPDDSGVTVPGCAGISFQSVISSVINILLFVAFLIALLFLILGGIKWILSGGEKDSANKARDTVTSALIGLAVVLGSWVLLNVILQILTGASLTTLKVPFLDTGTTQ